MDTKAEIALREFLYNFDSFIVDCDDFEAQGGWNTRRLGPMSAYFQTDLFGVVLAMMNADGVFEHAEAEVISQMFGTTYTPAELRDTYRSLKPQIDDYLDAEAEDAIERLSALDEGLASAYRQLILDAATVVSMADGVEERQERSLLRRLWATLEEE